MFRMPAVSLTVVSLLVAGCVSADETSPDEPALPGAKSTPSRIALTPTAHPRKEMAFAWRTDEGTTSGSVQVRRSGEKRVVEEGRDRTVTFPGWNYTSRHHAAVVRGLRPDTAYRYRVGTTGAWSRWRTFRTAHGPHQRWRFAYFGDAQSSLDTVWKHTVDRALDHRNVDLLLHAGDLVNEPTDDSLWSQWFRGLSPHRLNTAMLPAVGNHELRDDSDLRQYRAHFRLPRTGPRATSFSVDYQGVRFIVLDTNDPSNRSQRRFLRRKLVGAGSRWAVVVFHKPVFASTHDRDTTRQRHAWLRTLERAGADLVLQGHDHVYARGFLRRRADAEAGPRREPMYAVANAGGKYYHLDNGHDWTSHGAKRVEAEEGVSTYQIVRVTPRALAYRSVVSATDEVSDLKVGETLDRFRITRR